MIRTVFWCYIVLQLSVTVQQIIKQALVELRKQVHTDELSSWDGD